MQINKQMTITELMTIDPMIPNILMREGLHCISCMAAGGETLEMAAEVHGRTQEEIDDLVAQINDYLSMT
jgi:hybrid cluster-associated redox disulfide protein